MVKDIPSECKVLIENFRLKPPCIERCQAKEIPSVVERVNGELKVNGCLTAHTILTLLEAQRLTQVFKKQNKKVLEDVSELSNKDFWLIPVSILLLHDVGKLADDYVERRGFKHWQVSALTYAKALKDFLGDKLALIGSYAILLHHEAMDWRRLEKTPHFTYLDEAFSLIYYTVSSNRLKIFKSNINPLLKQLANLNIITNSQHNMLKQILEQSLNVLAENYMKNIDLGSELEKYKFSENIRYLVPSLFLYRIVYLADNRAASARERFWENLIKNINWNNSEEVAEQIVHVLSRQRQTRYVGLSAIPDLTN
ncbi:hypothetical protein CW703_05270 [Candidatus Bathyarchaeota archaeon]|nr:MAG: hypothetical protein CW703_05270 [Candidatus Bathyarchaeota archaeon]